MDGVRRELERDLARIHVMIIGSSMVHGQLMRQPSMQIPKSIHAFFGSASADFAATMAKSAAPQAHAAVRARTRIPPSFVEFIAHQVVHLVAVTTWRRRASGPLLIRAAFCRIGRGCA